MGAFLEIIDRLRITSYFERGEALRPESLAAAAGVPAAGIRGLLEALSAAAIIEAVDGEGIRVLAMNANRAFIEYAREFLEDSRVAGETYHRDMREVAVSSQWMGTEAFYPALLETIFQAKPTRIVDLGAGAGGLLIKVLTAFPAATGVALDVAPDACAAAQAAAWRAGVADRLTVVEASIQSLSARLIALAERLMLPAAQLREELGLPGMTITETMPFRDKVSMKLRIRESGIRVPEFSVLSEAAAHGLFMDHPVLVAKPTLSPCRDVAVVAGPLLDDLLSFNQRVIECYPGFTGVTHHEMFVTGDGICHCEIAARAGGGGVAAGFWSRTGVNLHEAAIQAQTIGSVPASIEVASHLTGWVIIYAGPGILQAPIRIPDDPWVIEARIQARPGDRLRAPASAGDGVAIVSVSGDTEAEVIKRLSSVTEVSHPKVAPIAV